jgi:hypothetical protein
MTVNKVITYVTIQWKAILCLLRITEIKLFVIYRENMAKFEECDMILIYHVFSVLILNVTKWIKSEQLMCPDPELLYNMWIKFINISTIKITMSPDTLTKLFPAVITILYL